MYSTDPPHDSYYLFWITVLMLGVGALAPWNGIITANLEGYYNDSHVEFELSVAYNIPCVTFLFFNIFLGPKIPLWMRIVIPLLLEVVILLVIPGALFLSDKMDHSIYILYAATGISGAGASVLFGSVMGLAAYFPPVYTTALMSGNGVAGIIIGLLKIITLQYVPNNNMSSLIYFGSAAFTMLICLILYFFSTRLEFVRYYQDVMESKKTDEKLPLLQSDKLLINEPDLAETPKYTFWLAIIKKIWIQCLNVFLVFFITLCLFPGMSVIIPSGRAGPNWFPVIIIFFFQVFDFVGRTIPVIPSLFPQHQETLTKYILLKKQYLVYPIVLRTLFTAVFIMCIKDIWFHGNGWAYGFQSVFAITNGYLGTLSMMYAPEYVNTEEKQTAGIIMSFCLNSGIFAGVLVAVGLDYLVNP